MGPVCPRRRPGAEAVSAGDGWWTGVHRRAGRGQNGPVTVPAFLLVLLAGVGSGLVGYLTGLASLVSYPALLAAGLPPVAANATNTLGVAAIGFGSSARGHDLLLERGRRHLGIQLALAAVGGGIGAALLVGLGEGAFTRVVPWLIAAGALALLLSPRLRDLRTEPVPAWVYWVGVALVCVYCGYFGAGAGTIYLAFAMITGSETFGRAMLLKSALLAVANVVAAVLFAVLAPVHWWAALALGLGCLVGGNLGPLVQRHLPQDLLRWVIAAAGFALAIWLGLHG